MAKFGRTSRKRLNTCDNRLQELFDVVVKTYDCTIVEGHRGMIKQNFYYYTKKSKLKFPNGKHNTKPSLAVDAAPYIKGKGIVWDKAQCYHFAGFVLGVATAMGINIRCGADWDGDKDVNDQKFKDLVHFELL